MRQNLSGSTGMGLGVGGGCGAIRNGSASGGGVQHVPATASGRRRLDYVNQWGQGAAAPCPNVLSEFDRR
jgi:hypothetical protein